MYMGTSWFTCKRLKSNSLEVQKPSRIVLLNGAAGSGKGILVNEIQKIHDVKIRSSKDRLKELVCHVFDVRWDALEALYEDRNTKELPQGFLEVTSKAYTILCNYLQKEPLQTDQAFIDLTIREAMIYVSEILIKPTFGEDYFGVYRANSIGRGELAIEDSCGFEEEIYPALEKLGEDNVLLLRIKGRGDFTGDSRYCIRDGVVPNTVDIYNTGLEADYLNEGCRIISEFYRK